MKNPITVLEDLQDDLSCSPLSAMQSLIDFAKHDLEGTIQGINQLVADYEKRLAMRDEEIAELEKHVDHETYFNRLSDGFEQLELNAEHEGVDAA
jgi:uncharacterized protein (DUF2164 family)